MAKRELGKIVKPFVIAEWSPDCLSAWISQNGTIHYTTYAAHYETARILGDETGGENMEDQGWIHLSGGFIRYYKDPTDAQMDALSAIADAIDVQVRDLQRAKQYIKDVQELIKHMR